MLKNIEPVFTEMQTVVSGTVHGVMKGQTSADHVRV